MRIKSKFQAVKDKIAMISIVSKIFKTKRKSSTNTSLNEIMNTSGSKIDEHGNGIKAIQSRFNSQPKPIKTQSKPDVGYTLIICTTWTIGQTPYRK